MARHRPVRSSSDNRYITGDIEPIPQPKVRTSAPLVEAVEPIKGDWSQNNNWGFTFDRSSGWPLVNNPSIYSIAQCQVFRGPPRIRGILLSRDDIYIAPIGTAGPSIQARITYGSGGISQQTIVDWGASTVVNLPASSLIVEAVVNGSNDDGFGGLVFGSVLSVNYSNEIIPKVGYTTLTQSWNTVTVLEVPPFATGFIIGNRGSAAVTDVIQGFSTSGGTSILSLPLVYTDANLGQINWLPSSVAYLVSGITATTVSISWVLSV